MNKFWKLINGDITITKTLERCWMFVNDTVRRHTFNLQFCEQKMLSGIGKVNR